MRSLAWGIIGTGGIAADFAESLRLSKRCRVVAVAGTSEQKARAFAAQWGVPKALPSVERLVSDPDVEAVYVASPHPFHEAHALLSIAARKPVLCEKPLSIDVRSTERIVAAAREANVFLMEAFMYRCHPLLGEVVSLLKAGAIGHLLHVRASFGYHAPRNPAWRIFNPALGGGGILDVGCYPVSFARLVAGLAEGKPFAEPVRIQADGLLGPTGVDELATALLSFASGFRAEVVCATRHAVGTRTVVYGEEGRLVLPDPWLPRGERQGLETEFELQREGSAPEVRVLRCEIATYASEAEWVLDSLPAVEPVWPAMSWADTLGNMRVMQAWREALG